MTHFDTQGVLRYAKARMEDYRREAEIDRLVGKHGRRHPAEIAQHAGRFFCRLGNRLMEAGARMACPETRELGCLLPQRAGEETVR